MTDDFDRRGSGADDAGALGQLAEALAPDAEATLVRAVAVSLGVGAEAVRDVRRAVIEGGDTGSDDATDAAWAATQRRAGLGDALTTRRTVPRGRRPRTLPAMAAAVSVALVVLVVAIRSVRRDSIVRTAERVYATGSGQRLTLTLHDGTRVMLAPRSTFATGADVPRLTGHAFFEVAPASRAWQVRAGGVTVRVLGTAFDVRAASRDGVRVAVLSGRVSVSTRSAERHAVVDAGHVVRVTDTTIADDRDADAERASAWTRERLDFDDVTAATVLQSLGRWYGYEFRLADSTIATRSVTLAVDLSDTQATLAAVRHLLGVTMSFDGRVVTLTPVATRSPSARDDRVRSRARWFPSPQAGR